MILLGKLPLPQDALIINYDLPASLYFDYERKGAGVLAKMEFLSAIATLESSGNVITAELLQQAGIGRKKLSKLMQSLFSVDMDRFKILDNKPLLESCHFIFDEDKEIVFDDSDADIYSSFDWEVEASKIGELEANIKDISRYAKINGSAIAERDFLLKPSQGGIGWLLGAILLKVIVSQGKLETLTPVPYYLSPNGLDTTSLPKLPSLSPQSE